MFKKEGIKSKKERKGKKASLIKVKFKIGNSLFHEKTRGRLSEEKCRPE